jgi:hypothetical protein
MIPGSEKINDAGLKGRLSMMTEKFPGRQRLNKEEDFKRLMKKGKQFRNNFFFFVFEK